MPQSKVHRLKEQLIQGVAKRYQSLRDFSQLFFSLFFPFLTPFHSPAFYKIYPFSSSSQPSVCLFFIFFSSCSSIFFFFFPFLCRLFFRLFLRGPIPLQSSTFSLDDSVSSPDKPPPDSLRFFSLTLPFIQQVFFFFLSSKVALVSFNLTLFRTDQYTGSLCTWVYRRNIPNFVHIFLIIIKFFLFFLIKKMDNTNLKCSVDD